MMYTIYALSSNEISKFLIIWFSSLLIEHGTSMPNADNDLEWEQFSCYWGWLLFVWKGANPLLMILIIVSLNSGWFPYWWDWLLLVWMGMTPLLMSLTYVSLNGNESLSDGARKLLVVMGMSPLLMRFISDLFGYCDSTG